VTAEEQRQWMIVRRQRLPALVDSDDSAQTSYTATHAHTQTLYTTLAETHAETTTTTTTV